MEDKDFSFKNLIVWQKAVQFTELVYTQVKLFPDSERYALSDQLRRAVVSIPSNIAEGAGRAGNRDYAHFLSIARGSLYETLTQIEIAVRLNYIVCDSDAYASIISLAREIARMLGSMLRKYGTIHRSDSRSPEFKSKEETHHCSTSTFDFDSTTTTTTNYN